MVFFKLWMNLESWQSPGQEHCKSYLMRVSEELFREFSYKISFHVNSTTLIQINAFKALKYQPSPYSSTTEK